MLVAAPAAHAQAWKVAEASVYGPWEYETRDALGNAITYSTKHIAVPIERRVTEKSWKNGSNVFKATHFYMKQKIKLRRGKRTVTASITDVGGFYSYGRYVNGKWVSRMFDLQPAVFESLGMGRNSTSIVKWKWCK